MNREYGNRLFSHRLVKAQAANASEKPAQTNAAVIDADAAVESAAPTTPPVQSTPTGEGEWSGADAAVIPVVQPTNRIEIIGATARPRATSPAETVAATVTGREQRDEQPRPLQTTCLMAAVAVLIFTLLMVAVMNAVRKRRKVLRQQTFGTAEIVEAAVGKNPKGISIGNAQHIGTREVQQDSFGMSNLNDSQLVSQRGFLAVVADGMGGLCKGDEISNAVVETMLHQFAIQQSSIEPAMRLLLLVQAAQNRVAELMTGLYQNGGSTVVATLIQNGMLYFISVGDSRIYLMRNGGLILLTREHIYASELDERAARNESSYTIGLHDAQRKALTSYIGMESLEKVDRILRPIRLIPGDRILLASDGVFGTLTDEELTAHLQKNAYDAANAICNAAVSKQRVHQDNLTAIVLEYEG